MPDRTSYALTPYQRGQLKLLLGAAALDRDTAIHAYEPAGRNLLPGVLGILLDKGFVEKRSRTRQRQTRTVYWLTEGGATLARQILEGEI